MQGLSGRVLGCSDGWRVKLDLQVGVAERGGLVCDEDGEENREIRQIH